MDTATRQGYIDWRTQVMTDQLNKGKCCQADYEPLCRDEWLEEAAVKVADLWDDLTKNRTSADIVSDWLLHETSDPFHPIRCRCDAAEDLREELSYRTTDVILWRNLVFGTTAEEA